MGDDQDVVKEFLIEVVRRCCILCVKWIEKRYKMKSSFLEK